MKIQAGYKRFSSDKKIDLINKVRSGKSVTYICLENGISRTIFYKWLKQFDLASAKNKDLIKALSPRNPKGKENSRKLKLNKEREVIKLWLNNPDYSLRNISRKAGVSTGGVWNIIDKYKQKVESDGRKKIKRYVKKSYKIFNKKEKIDLIMRHQSGESISKLAKEEGISRTIFYKWMSEYAVLENKELALQDRRARGVKHWRFMPGMNDLIKEIVYQNPQLSLSAIVSWARAEGHQISKSGVYYILKRLELSTYDARLSYIASINTSGVGSGRVEFKRDPISENLAFYMPQFAVFTLFWLVFSYLLLQAKTPYNTKLHRVDIATVMQNTIINISHKADKIKFVMPIESKQDFRWGALAINSPKSQDSSHQAARVGFGLVDHAGNTICNAQLGLQILSQSGKKVFDSNVSNQSIRQSSNCSLQSVTNTPDYQVEIPTLTQAGDYKLHVLANTYEGERQFESKLIVSDNAPIEIKRESYPTRIFPLASYPVEISIKIKQDFKGVISDNFPKGIKASKVSLGGLVIAKQGNNDQVIRWRVEWKKGETHKMKYVLNFPQIWPEFYEIGPLKFTDEASGQLIFQESKYWQIVADALD